MIINPVHNEIREPRILATNLEKLIKQLKEKNPELNLNELESVLNIFTLDRKILLLLQFCETVKNYLALGKMMNDDHHHYHHQDLDLEMLMDRLRK